jgi:hypothetical protein
MVSEQREPAESPAGYGGEEWGGRGGGKPRNGSPQNRRA